MGARVITLPLGGVSDRPLFYRTQDVMAAESRMTKSLVAALSERSVSDLVTMLWAGFRSQNQHLTPDKVAEWIDEAKKREDMSAYTLWDRVAEGLYESGIVPRPKDTGVPVSETDPT